jgi:hypothetical protein
MLLCALAIPIVAAGAQAVGLVGSVALTLWPGPGMPVAALALVGLGYGLISGITAAAGRAGAGQSARGLPGPGSGAGAAGRERAPRATDRAKMTSGPGRGADPPVRRAGGVP